MQHFVFLMFRDPHVVGVLDFLSESLNGRRWRHAPHLTIQGPYEERPTADQLAAIEQRLRGDTFLIANPGVFETKKGSALYLSVSSERLRRVWNKPDYPTEKYGFNPHITLYDGIDVDKAHRAFQFLRSGRHRIELICRDFSVAIHTSKQGELFPGDEFNSDANAVERLIAGGKVSSSFRAAFLSAVKD